MRCLSICLLLAALVSPAAAEDAKYLLAAKLAERDVSSVEVTLEVGGDMLLTDEQGEQKLPLSVRGELRYLEQILNWSEDTDQAIRALRVYDTATAKIQVEKAGLQRELPQAKQTIAAEVRDGRATLASAAEPLTRDQYDLVNVVGNSLALNRLLPDRELAEGETWEHEKAAIGALLGMDHIAVCEVSSVVTGSQHNQVQIRLAGTVQGTIDGAPTEMQLRGAYLFHQTRGRISKLNLAIKEARTASQVVPGLDVVAKVSVTVVPTKKSFPKKTAANLLNVSRPLESTLRYEAPQLGYRFLHEQAWYVIAEQRDMVTLRSLQEGNWTAHCNITTLPARSEGRETNLEQFERDVRSQLGDNLDTVTASTQWTTSQGHECLGVIARGTVEKVPMEWRYYLLASPGLPRVSLGVTIEQAQLERFADADRVIVDSLELLKTADTSTAKAESDKAQR